MESIALKTPRQKFPRATQRNVQSLTRALMAPGVNGMRGSHAVPSAAVAPSGGTETSKNRQTNAANVHLEILLKSSLAMPKAVLKMLIASLAIGVSGLTALALVRASNTALA